jgi:hypothetical protein
MQTQHKVRLPKMTEKDQQFENLLRRAAEFLKRRQVSPAVKTERKRHNAAA